MFKCTLCNFKTFELKELQDHICQNVKQVYIQDQPVDLSDHIKPGDNIDEEKNLNQVYS